MRILLQHQSRYRYPKPASLGPHLVRLRPAAHAKAKVETYALHVTTPGELRWQQDPAGNFVARLSYPPSARIDELLVEVELAVEIRPVNPFDFTLDPSAEHAPFAYGPLQSELAPYLEAGDPAFALGELARAFLAELPREGRTVPLIVELNRRVHERVRYVIREEPGVWTPEETLREGRGSCRDSAVLLIAALRSRGLAARFASGYLVQLTDEGMLPDQPKGVSRDVVDLHAWAEVYLPGAGWVGLDATSGLLCGEGHIPLACTAAPRVAAAIEGTSDVRATQVSFELKIGRLGHEPRPTAPFTDEVWGELSAAGAATDALLRNLGVALTAGGEPTFNSREHPEAPEWNGEALGPTKWTQGLRLSRELLARLCPGGALLVRQGKHYPGESLPRWTIDLIGRRDGARLWSGDAQALDRASQPGAASLGAAARAEGQLLGQARALAQAIAAELRLDDAVHEAFEDGWRFLQDEARLPVDVDPLAADLGDPEERRRLAHVLDRGLGSPAGYVLPLDRFGGTWRTERWAFRRGRLYLLQGDSTIGLRLPLASLGGAPPPLESEPPPYPPDPRGPESAAVESEYQARIARLLAQRAGLPAPQRPPPVPAPTSHPVRTALCVEPRGGALCVFLPPQATEQDFVELVRAIDAARGTLEGNPAVLLEGYPPPGGPSLLRVLVAPDPGVLEVNLPPTRTFDEHARLVDHVFEAALHAGLHAEKYLLDGRQAGSGGGNHLTLGGRTAVESPFVRDPRLLASLITFVQHHPSLAYLFSGLFVGPTSQAPRVDEARHDSLYELEIALARAHESGPGTNPAPWLSDVLFRNLLVDVTGNTHRAELCIDKLFDYRTPHGRQGLVELRAFEMPPHPRMMVAQLLLVRAIVAALASRPLRAPLLRFGQSLHDKFLLPHFLWNDLLDVLAFLKDRGLALPAEAYRAFLELRCPIAGQLRAGEVLLEVRNALEPWHVLGEEPNAAGTSRYVDSSVERVEVRAAGLVPERHRVLINGHVLPLHPTATAGEAIGGVRFRAWAPPHSLHAHLGIHHPLRFDVLDLWARRSLGACAYHVWHPEGRAYGAQPLTRFEASARRAQRFTIEGALSWPVSPKPAQAHPDQPYTLDLRRLGIDRPQPRLSEEDL